MTKAVLLSAFVGSCGLTPLCAEAGVELPWPAQMGITSMLGGLLWYKDRTSNEALKTLGDQHEKANDKLCEEVKGLRDDHKQFADQQIAMMRECLLGRRDK